MNNNIKYIQIRYGACGMQGWRKRMEDAHIADINLGNSGQIHIFGVFDGHGGKEVAQFVANHFSQELINSGSYKSGDLKNALIEKHYKRKHGSGSYYGQ